MRYFRHMSPISRVFGAVGLLLILASFALASASLFMSWMSYPHVAAGLSRADLVSMDLGLLGLAVIIVLNDRNIRRALDRPPFSPSSWQSQIRIILLVAALPLCGLSLAILLPPSLSIYGLAFGISALAACVLPVSIYVLAARR